LIENVKKFNLRISGVNIKEFVGKEALIEI